MPELSCCSQRPSAIISLRVARVEILDYFTDSALLETVEVVIYYCCQIRKVCNSGTKQSWMKGTKPP